MKTHLLAYLVVGILACGCNIHINGLTGTPGSGTVVTESRELATFSKIRYGGSAKIRVVQGEPSSVEITCDDNLLQYIATDVEGDTLHLKTTQNINPTGQMAFDIVCNELQNLRLSGSGSAKVIENQSQSLEVRLSGSGSAELENVQTTSLKVGLSGSGGVRGTGVAETLEARVSGSGSISFRELLAKSVTATASGSGGMTVNASDEFQGSVSGSGSIKCYGQPETRQQHASGSGRITFAD